MRSPDLLFSETTFSWYKFFIIVNCKNHATTIQIHENGLIGQVGVVGVLKTGITIDSFGVKGNGNKTDKW